MHVQIDDALVTEAMQVANATTAEQAVSYALREYLRVKRQLAALDALQGLGWEGDLDDMRTSKYIPAK
ncbi:type II toxin-antitoxin system VapB family antitoxin [Sphingomonas sp. RIT328]|uniref:type II toxin-antitoxin system VapB family antitoxin n=1 Tax=Sphingomonas sp. RIT328 TaxID=1470591 RepID=UPI000450DC50|nr:type II toxin-antitoxin system VapB family antitoxin [Sphingomonas sp. RIT328]EZP56529.1 Antitoxin VapB11 [Sphingomonas sp. RIT328]